jgi:hypothetical protein
MTHKPTHLCHHRTEPVHGPAGHECQEACWSQGRSCRACPVACYRQGWSKRLVDADNAALVASKSQVAQRQVWPREERANATRTP